MVLRQARQAQIGRSALETPDRQREVNQDCFAPLVRLYLQSVRLEVGPIADLESRRTSSTRGARAKTRDDAISTIPHPAVRQHQP